MYLVNFRLLCVALISCFFLSTTAQARVDASGNWTMFYDWDCDGSFGAVEMILNSNHTWTSSEGYNGKWVRQEGMIIFNFSNSKTVYNGNIASKSITGINTTFKNNLSGCFYMLQEGATPLASQQASETSETMDSQGKIIEK